MDIAWENLGDELKALLVPVYSNSKLLPFAFEDLHGAKEILEDVAGARCSQEELRVLALELCQWKKNYEGYFKRRRTSFVRPLLKEPVFASQPAGRPLTAASVSVEICNRQLVLKFCKRKSTYSRSLLLEGAVRSELKSKSEASGPRCWLAGSWRPTCPLSQPSKPHITQLRLGSRSSEQGGLSHCVTGQGLGEQ